MKKGKKIFYGICVLILSGTVLAAGIFGLIYAFNKPTATLNFAKKTGDVTTCASGFLYGLAEPDIPSVEIAASVGISTLSTKASGGLQHPVGDIAQVAETFFNAGGKEIIVYTQDMYDTWYYRLDSMPAYLERVRQTVSATEAEDYADRVVYCIFNEMNNGQWFGDFKKYENRLKTYAAWKETYQLVKSINPNARIGGPGYTHYDSDYQREFLEYCKAENCLPQTMIWHELGSSSLYNYEDHFADYAQMCAELDIEEMPVCITEYGLMETNGIPGESVKWISRIESTKAEACVAYWRLANNLSDVAADDVTPNSNWWAYHWYAQMTGETVSSTAKDLFQSNFGKFLTFQSKGLKNKGFSALATIDEGAQSIQILAGGSSRDSKLVLENLDTTEAFKNTETVCVTAEYINYKGLSGAVYTPETKFTRYLPVQNGKVKIDLQDILYTQCYNITVTPTEIAWSDYESGMLSIADYEQQAGAVQRFEAEQAEVFGTAHKTDDIAYAASERAMVKLDSAQESGVEFTVEAATDGMYAFDLIYGNGANGVCYADDGSVTDKGERTAITAEVTVDGENIQAIKLPSTLKDDFTDFVTFSAELTEGKHRIRITLPQNTEISCTLSFDFLDMVLFEYRDIQPKMLPDAANSGAEQTAFYAVVDMDGYYSMTFSSDAASDTVILNSKPLSNALRMQNETEFECILYLHRGLNAVAVNAGNAVCFGINWFDGGENNQITVVAAEQCAFTGKAVLQNSVAEQNVGTAANSYIAGISSETESTAAFTYDAPQTGYYQFTFTYSNNEEGGVHDYNVDLIERYITLSVNGEKQGNFYFRNTYSLQTYKTKTVLLHLSKGAHEIAISNDGSYTFNGNPAYAPQICKISIAPAVGR